MPALRAYLSLGRNFVVEDCPPGDALQVVRCLTVGSQGEQGVSSGSVAQVLGVRAVNKIHMNRLAPGARAVCDRSPCR
ncbi:Hypothetical predicted protein, partial [Pelobates cultripes]